MKILNNILRPWNKNHPRSASSWGWYKIGEEDKKKYPIRNYLMEEIFDEIFLDLKYRYKKFFRLVPFSENSSCLPTGLKRHTQAGSSDMLLQAAFIQFSKIVEMYKEDSLDFYKTMQKYTVPNEDYNYKIKASLAYKKSKLTQCSLYHWWKNIRPNRTDPLDDFYKRKDLPKDFQPTTFAWAHDSEIEEIKQHKYYNLFLEWEVLWKEYTKLIKEWEREDEHMFKNLISYMYSMEW